jgi:hypothetical protein
MDSARDGLDLALGRLPGGIRGHDLAFRPVHARRRSILPVRARLPLGQYPGGYAAGADEGHGNRAAAPSRSSAGCAGISRPNAKTNWSWTDTYQRKRRAHAASSRHAPSAPTRTSGRRRFAGRTAGSGASGSKCAASWSKCPASGRGSTARTAGALIGSSQPM